MLFFVTAQSILGVMGRRKWIYITRRGWTKGGIKIGEGRGRKRRCKPDEIDFLAKKGMRR